MKPGDWVRWVRDQGLGVSASWGGGGLRTHRDAQSWERLGKVGGAKTAGHGCCRVQMLLEGVLGASKSERLGCCMAAPPGPPSPLVLPSFQCNSPNSTECNTPAPPQWTNVLVAQRSPHKHLFKLSPR